MGGYHTDNLALSVLQGTHAITVNSKITFQTALSTVMLVDSPVNKNCVFEVLFLLEVLKQGN